MTTSRSIIKTIGFAFVAAGLPPLAIALGWLIVPAENLPAPLWTMGCAGAALDFAGLALLVPESLPKPRGLLAAFSITALAALFDWIALDQFHAERLAAGMKVRTDGVDLHVLDKVVAVFHAEVGMPSRDAKAAALLTEYLRVHFFRRRRGRLGPAGDAGL